MLRQMYFYTITITYLIQRDRPYIGSLKNILENFVKSL